MFNCPHGAAILDYCLGKILFVVVSSIYMGIQLKNNIVSCLFLTNLVNWSRQSHYCNGGCNGGSRHYGGNIRHFNDICNIQIIFPTDWITQHLSFFMRSGELISLRFMLAPGTPRIMNRHFLHSQPADSVRCSIHIIKLTYLFSCMCWGLKLLLLKIKFCVFPF